MMTTTDGNDDDVTKQSAFVSFATMVCRKEKRFFFSFYFIFLKKISFSLLQRILQVDPLIIFVESQHRWK